jgi:hypothetical protein
VRRRKTAKRAARRKRRKKKRMSQWIQRVLLKRVCKLKSSHTWLSCWKEKNGKS